MPISVETYLGELSRELKNILSYWQTYMPDVKHGGFYGLLDGQNRPDKEAPKGVILNTRILWTFSAACMHSFSEEKRQWPTGLFNTWKHIFATSDMMECTGNLITWESL